MDTMTVITTEVTVIMVTMTDITTIIARYITDRAVPLKPTGLPRQAAVSLQR
jgi:hypothetical protein